jgi:hypothetical protein
MPWTILTQSALIAVLALCLASTRVTPAFAKASEIPSPSPSPSTPPTASVSPQAAIHPSAARGDEAFKKRNIAEKAKEALELYREAYQADPKNSEHGWRLAVACYFVGHRLTPNEKEQEKIFNEGQLAGKQASELDPKCAPCQFWTAINMALYGQAVGVVKMLFTLDEIQTRLKKVIALDPGYAGSGAYRLLGTIQWKLPGILGGSNKRAKENFEKAIETSPNETLNYLFLARLLRKEYPEEDAKAIELAKQGLAVDKSKLERVESFEALEDLRKFVAGQDVPR